MPLPGAVPVTRSRLPSQETTLFHLHLARVRAVASPSRMSRCNIHCIFEQALSHQGHRCLTFLGDLEHLRAVKVEKHQQFAKEKDMPGYFVSAKTGESVENLFRQVTAQLMHIALPKNDYDATRTIKASIVRQESHNSTPLTPNKDQPNQSRTSICSLQ